MLRSEFLLTRAAAYVMVFVFAYVLVGAAVFAAFGEGTMQRASAACVALLCLIAGRCISGRAWAKRGVEK